MVSNMNASSLKIVLAMDVKDLSVAKFKALRGLIANPTKK